MTNIAIRLDKEDYFTGEKVKGTLDIPSKSTKFKNFVLFAYGEEQTQIYQVDSPYTSSGAAGGIKFSSRNIFINQDLSGYLLSGGGSLHDQTLEMPDGLNEIQFEYIIPRDAIESYNGKHASISYGITAKAERKWLPDINVKTPFHVRKESKRDDHNKRFIKEGNSNGVYLKIDLEKNVLTPGEIVGGQLTIENPKGHRIRGIKMSLIGSERATAEYKVHLSKRVDHIERITPMEKYHMDVAWKDGTNVPFKIDFPKGMKKSYRGKYSEYFWILDTELNAMFARNFHLKD